jgi:hypothetical protein
MDCKPFSTFRVNPDCFTGFTFYEDWCTMRRMATRQPKLPEPITTADAIRLAGSKTELARILGITRIAIYKWGTHPPAGRMWELMRLRPEWFRRT